MARTKPSTAVFTSLLVGLLFDAAALAQQTTDGGVTYAIDSEQSQLHVLVYRAGVLGRMGHNHIISAGHFEGTVHLHTDVSKSVFELTLPVAEFTVDDLTLRQAEGDGFDSVPSQKDIDGTRRNMLGKRLLEAANFPAIQVSGGGLRLEGTDEPAIEIVMQVKNTSAARRVPLTLAIGDEEITASGVIVLTHKELGLRPFSAALGALKVASSMTIRFSLTFRRTDSPAAPGGLTQD